MTKQTDTQKQLRRGAILLGIVAMLLWSLAILMPTPKQITQKFNGHIVAVIPNTDPRFPHEVLKMRLFIGGCGVVFGLFALLCRETYRKQSDI